MREGLELGEGRGWQEPARGIDRKARGELGDLKGPHSGPCGVNRDRRLVQERQGCRGNLGRDDV